MKKQYDYKGEKVTMNVSSYQSNKRLAIILTLDSGEVFETFTTNLEDSNFLDVVCQFVENTPDKVAFILENDLGEIIHRNGVSGFKTYCLVKFSEELLK